MALAVNLGLAKALLIDAPEQAAAILDQLKADAGDALETLRDLARGLFPPLLADRGLVFALQSHINKVNLNASVEGEGVEELRFEPGLEAAIYFCIREALQNASKHAGGAPITVLLAWSEDRLSFDVQDSGPGFMVDGVVRGSGLQNMADRVEALGGTFSIASTPGEGTRISGTVPAPALVTQPR